MPNECLKRDAPCGIMTARCIFMLIIHSADIHLGASPDAGEPWGKNRKQELWDSFDRLIETVRAQQADIFLIAGDLFHRPPLLRELREVNERFASLRDTRVVLIAGNHDHIGENSFYRNFVWADNVTFLKDRKLTGVRLKGIPVDVYGLSYDRKEITERLYDGAKPEQNGCYHILLAHGGDENHIPFSAERLRESGFDYIAFGHIHKPGMLVQGRAVMAGSLEPTDHTCLGTHGYVRVETNGRRNEISLVPFAKREYRKLVLELTENDTMGSIFRSVSEQIAAEGKQHIYEIILRGRRHETLEIFEEKLKTAGNIRKISDETEVFYDYGRLRRKYEGRLLQRYIDSFAGAEGTLEKKALAYGTAAILEASDE